MVCKAHERTLRRGVGRYYKDKYGRSGDKELHEMLAVMDYSGSVPLRVFMRWVTKFES